MLCAVSECPIKDRHPAEFMLRVKEGAGVIYTPACLYGRGMLREHDVEHRTISVITPKGTQTAVLKE